MFFGLLVVVSNRVWNVIDAMNKFDKSDMKLNDPAPFEMKYYFCVILEIAIKNTGVLQCHICEIIWFLVLPLNSHMKTVHIILLEILGLMEESVLHILKTMVLFCIYVKQIL